jgi:hypothetical protein
VKYYRTRKSAAALAAGTGRNILQKLSIFNYQ